MRVTAFVTNTTKGQLADLELRHRRRARCEDRIRLAKDTGLANLPLHSFAANRIWCATVALAAEITAEITAWMQLLALPGHHTGTRHDGGNPRRCASDYSPSPRPWPAPAGGCACTWPPGHPSPAWPYKGWNVWQPSSPVDPRLDRPDNPLHHPRAVDPAAPARQRSTCHTPGAESATNTTHEP